MGKRKRGPTPTLSNLHKKLTAAHNYAISIDFSVGDRPLNACKELLEKMLEHLSSQDSCSSECNSDTDEDYDSSDDRSLSDGSSPLRHDKSWATPGSTTVVATDYSSPIARSGKKQPRNRTKRFRESLLKMSPYGDRDILTHFPNHAGVHEAFHVIPHATPKHLVGILSTTLSSIHLIVHVARTISEAYPPR